MIRKSDAWRAEEGGEKMKKQRGTREEEGEGVRQAQREWRHGGGKVEKQRSEKSRGR